MPHSVFLQLVVGVQVRCGREAASRPGTRGVLARARGTRERGRKIRNAHERGRLRTGLPWNTNGGGGNTNAQEHEQESMNTSTQENERGRQKRRTPRKRTGWRKMYRTNGDGGKYLVLEPDWRKTRTVERPARKTNRVMENTNYGNTDETFRVRGPKWLHA